MTATHESIIKSDRRGRLRYTPEHKAALTEAYEASGLSGPRFAAIHGVNYQTLDTCQLDPEEKACGFFSAFGSIEFRLPLLDSRRSGGRSRCRRVGNPAARRSKDCDHLARAGTARSVLDA